MNPNRMEGLFFTNRYYTDGGTEYAYRRLSECLQDRGHRLTKVNTPPVVFQGGQDNLTAIQADFGVFWDKDVLAAAMLERSGMLLFNRAESIRLCDDKRLTYAALQDSGIPLVPTIAAPLCYKTGAEDLPLIEQIEQTLGYPVIVKAAKGSLGAQVTLCKTREALNAIRQSLGNVPHLYQAFVAESAGRDVRVYVIGGKVVGCLRRENRNGICANRSAGGGLQQIVGNATLCGYALQAAEILQLDYMAADFSDTAEPLLFEVNSNAYFEGIEDCGGRVAEAYAAHIIARVNGGNA